MHSYNIQEQQKMGADCTRSYQADYKANSPHRALIQKKYYKKNLNQEIIINAYSWIPNHENFNLVNQNNAFQSQILNSDSDCIKFIPHVGFQIVQSNGNPINYQIYFKYISSNENNPKVQIRTNLEDQVWKKISNTGCFLNQGNQIRLGNTKLKLKFWLNSNQINKEKYQSSMKLRTCPDPSAQCRFCLQSAVDPRNPLVMPCNCQGSVSVVHQRCLSDWIFNYTGTFHQAADSFTFKVRRAQCQLCKQSFENYIWYRMMNLMSIYEGSYAILQLSVCQNKTKPERQYVVFRFRSKSQTLNVGRPQLCDYQYFDLCMQDVHAIFAISNGRLFIKDNQSKRGTYISTKNRYFTMNDSYQIGDVYFSLKANTDIGFNRA